MQPTVFVDTRTKVNIHKTFPSDVLKSVRNLCAFNVDGVSTGMDRNSMVNWYNSRKARVEIKKI